MYSLKKVEGIKKLKINYLQEVVMNNKRLFSSLRQQLAHEVFFVDKVGRAYIDTKEELDIVDFEYKNQPMQLTLNGKIMLKSKQGETKVESYQDLIQGLLHTKSRSI